MGPGREPYSDLTVASSPYDILLCYETMVSDMLHVSELLVPGFGPPVLLCRARCLRPEGWLHTYKMVTKHFANPNLSVVVVKLFFRVCGVRQNLHVFSLYRNPDLDDRIFYCLPASTAEEFCCCDFFLGRVVSYRENGLMSVAVIQDLLSEKLHGMLLLWTLWYSIILPCLNFNTQ